MNEPKLELKPNLLIVGSRPGSLGAAIHYAAEEWGDFRKICSAGITDEHVKLDVTNSNQIKEVLQEFQPDHIVVTVGVNEPASLNARFLDSIMTDAFRVNVIGVMAVLRHWVELLEDQPRDTCAPRPKFVAISSNSARIARTRSMPYCASKAALSMALRVAGRELARSGSLAPLVWGYEPGLLDTDMTHKLFEGGMTTLHRMEGVPQFGLPVSALADRIISDLMADSQGLNGCMIPFDGGEQ